MNNPYIHQSQEIEQLWYTSSKYGLGSMTVGHRIRAASQGLSDLTSPLVQMLEPYLQYALPAGVDALNTIPDQAPLSLSLGDLAGYGRILVNKRHTGRDAGGRPGLFFSHLLYSPLLAAFPAKDAILLWRTPFWRLSDDGQGPSTVLPHLTEYEAPEDYAAYFNGPLQGRYEGKYERATFKRISPPRRPKPDFSKLQDCLRFVFQAYLTLQGHQQIYLAAPPDMVADVLFGLTRCLPRLLLSKLTFSTYERSVEDKPFLLVGTFWDQQTRSTLDLPAACYTDHLAYNSFSGNRSDLKASPLVQHFTDYAVKRLVSENFAELDRLIEKTETLPGLDTRTFLQYYRQMIIEAQQPTKDGVAGCFETPDTAADFLSRERVQEFITEAAIKDPAWRESVFKPGLQSLATKQKKYQGLTETLAEFAMTISQKTPAYVETWYNEGATKEGYAQGFTILLEMLSWIADTTSEAWQQQPGLLLQPQRQPIFLQFVRMYPDVHFTLLGCWAKLDPLFEVQKIQPLLDLKLLQDRLPRFYDASLPLSWKRYVTEQVIRSFTALPPGPGEADISEMIATYLEIDWYRAEELFLSLAQRGYPYTFDLLMTLLKSRMIPPGAFTRLISQVPLKHSEQLHILKNYGPKFLPIPDDEKAMLKLLGHFSTSPQADFAHKQDLLLNWLKSPYPPAQSWFVQSGNLDKVLKRVNLTIPAESNWFLEEFGSTPLISQASSTIIDDYNRQFLENLDLRKMGKSGYLEYLERNPDALKKLPRVTQQRVENQIRLDRLLKNLSFHAQDLQALAEEVLGRGLAGGEKLAVQLVDLVANVLALHVQTDTQLAALVLFFKPVFSSFTFQIFYRMAEIVRDYNTQQDTKMLCGILLKPYIRFALSSDAVFVFPSDRDYTLFIYTFLDLLLQSTSESEIQQLDIGIEVTGVPLQRWETYKTVRRTAAPVDIARLNNVQSLPANQQIPSQSRVGGHGTRKAQSNQSKQDRQPYQNPAPQPAQQPGQQQPIQLVQPGSLAKTKKPGLRQRILYRFFPPDDVSSTHIPKKM